MLDVKLIREEPDLVKRGIKAKGTDPKLVDEFLALDEKWRKLTKALDDLRATQKRFSEKRDKEGGQEIKEQIRKSEEKLRAVAAERDAILDRLPNLPFPDVPVGGEEANTVLREVGTKPDFGFAPKDYMALAGALDLIDTEKAAAVSGTRFGYLKNDAVLLEFALVTLTFETLIPEGFIPVVPPVMIRPDVYRGMGRLSGDQKEERYFLEKDNLYLAGSAEHTVGPLHMHDTIPRKELPTRYVAFSTCFRREAGSYGKDTKGILRVHQFDKVEMFSFAHPEESEQEHAFLLALQEKLMAKLGLPYRVVELATQDMGWTDARQYDIETWMPGEGRYRETHSCSHTTDFQARGINAKFAEGNATGYVHMLNATAVAIGRTLAAILENNQTKDGKIKVPKVLHEYVGKDVIG